MNINARKYVAFGIPAEEGRKLATVVMALDDLDWDVLEIDLRQCRAGLLISAFFNGFLQQVYEDAPLSLCDARKIAWQLKHPFQRENVARWMRDFEPVDIPHHAGA